MLYTLWPLCTIYSLCTLHTVDSASSAPCTLYTVHLKHCAPCTLCTLHFAHYAPSELCTLCHTNFYLGAVKICIRDVIMSTRTEKPLNRELLRTHHNIMLSTNASKFPTNLTNVKRSHNSLQISQKYTNFLFGEKSQNTRYTYRVHCQAVLLEESIKSSAMGVA